MPTIPYTYLLTWSTTGMKYYGVRYATNCNPTDLWNPYKTSSKYVREYVSAYGDPDLIQIRKTFSLIESARTWEHKVLKRLNAARRYDYLNRTDNYSISPEDCGRGAKAAAPTRKGRTKFNNSGVARTARKLTGRTKETHANIAEQARKLTGRTKETHANIAEQARKLTGRTKETHSYLAGISSKMTGRTKETHSHLAKHAENVVQWVAKHWEITHPNGEKTTTFNISEWCRNNNFPRGSVTTKKIINGHAFAIKFGDQL
jgi:hypothetical protein